MSKNIDENVVSMRFDNADFERNVKTSMSTLDRLKSALKFDKVQNGANELTKAFKKVDLTPVDNGVQKVQASFSALQVVGMTALANITNSAINAGKQLVNAFAISPITDGFAEYETQMNSVQTIMANTASKGTTIEQVTDALNELNKYADDTIYNFAQMTHNIGTFTAAGVDLDKATAAIKGIANLGAMSGSTATQVSTAMYQLSQALATGKVSLMDWNSVVNAGMGGEQFQNALKRTAEHFGTDVDAMIEKYGSFRESLTQGGWLTADVLTETLNQLSGAYTEADLIAQGYSEDQAKAITKMAETAENAATKVTGFTKLMDTLKEAVGSGWAQTFQILFGDFYEAREFFTDLSNYLGDIIQAVSDARNALLGGAFDSKWGEFTKQLEDSGISVDDYTQKLQEVANESGDVGAKIQEMLDAGYTWDMIVSQGVITTDMFTEALNRVGKQSGDTASSTGELSDEFGRLQQAVHDVWMGNYGNIDTGRIERLTEAGYDYAQVQDLVNRTVNDRKLDLEDLTDAEIQALGLSEQETQVLSDMAKAAQDASDPMHDLIQSMSRPSGRVLFLESIQNILYTIMEPIKAVGEAFGDVFSFNSSDLYNLIDGFHSLTEEIKPSDEQLQNIKSTFRGLFSLVKIVATLVGGPVSVAFKLLRTILGLVDVDILSITASIGDAIYAFEQWIDSGQIIQTAFEAIGDVVSALPGPIKDFVSAIGDFGPIKKASDAIAGLKDTVVGYFTEIIKMKPQDALKKIGKDIQKTFNDLIQRLRKLKWSDVLDGLRDLGEKIREKFTEIVDDVKTVGPDIIEGLQNGLTDGAQNLYDFMSNIGQKLIDAVKAILGIHSPSTVFFDIGVNIIQGLCNGIKFLSGEVTDTLSAIIEDLKQVASGIDWNTVFAVGAGVGTFVVLYQLTDALQTFATGMKQFSAPFQQASNVMGTIDGFLKKLTDGNSSSKGLQNIGQGIKLMAEGIAILAASVAVLAQIDTGSLIKATAVIVILAGVLGGLAIALDKFANGANLMQSINISGILLSLAGAFTLLAVAAKIVSGIDDQGFVKASAMLLEFGLVVAALVYVNQFGGDVDQVSKVLTKIGTAFLMLAIAARIIGGMDETSMVKAGVALAAFGAVVAGLAYVNQFGGEVEQVSKILSKIGVAFLLLAATAKILGTMTPTEMATAGVMLFVFTSVVAGLVAVNQFGGEVNRAATVLKSIGTAFLLLGVTARLLGGMKPEEMGKATVMIAVFGAVVAGLVAATKLAPEGEIAKISLTLIAMSASIAILGAVAVLLGKIDPAQMTKGLAAVTVLAVIVGALTLVAKGANSDMKATLIGLSIAIAAVAASAVVLSLIEPTSLAKATAALTILLGSLALVVGAAGNIKKATSTMVLLAVMIAELTASLYLLSTLPTESVLGSAVALSMVMASLAAALKVMGSVRSVSKSAMKSMGVLVAVMASLAIIFGALAALNLEVSLNNAITLSVVLEAMAVATVILGKVGSVSKSAQKTMAVLTAVMAGLAVIFGILGALGIETSMNNALTLSVVLEAMAAAVVILGTVGRVSKSAMEAMVVLTAIMAALAVIFGTLAALNIEVSLQNALSLSIVLEALAAACVILSGVQSVSGGALAAMAVLGLVIGELGVIFGLLSGFDLSISLETAASLSLVLIAMSAATGILAGIGPVATSALAGATALAGVLGVITGVIAAAGALKQIPGFEWLISEGGAMLQQVGNAIGQFIGGFAGGALEGLTASLPEVATSLSDFMVRLTPFLLGASMITPESMNSIKLLAEAILLLTAGNLVNQLTSFLTGGASFSDFAQQIVPLGTALAQFSAALGPSFNGESVQQAASAAQSLAQMANALPKEGGLAQAVFGESTDMGAFGVQLVLFGTALATFSSVTGDIDTEKLQQTAQAGQALADLATSLPKEGGLAQAIFGESTDMGTFGTQIVQFGNALVDYSNAVSGTLDIEAINQSVTAGQALADLADAIPSSGGVIELFTGGSDFKKFGEQLVAFGNALVEYSGAVADVDYEQINGATKAVKAVVDFVTANADIDTGSTENLKTVFTNFSDALSTLTGEEGPNGEMLQTIADGLQTFGTAAQTVAGVDFTVVTSSLSTFATEMVNLPTTLTTTATAFTQFGIAMMVGTLSFSMVATSLGSGASAISRSMQMLSAAIMLGSASAQAALMLLIMTMTATAPQFSVIGNLIVTNFITGSRSALELANTEFQNAGNRIAESFKSAIINRMQTIPSAIKVHVNDMVSAVQGKEQDFYDAGANMMRGLANGISNNANRAIDAAAQAAAQSLKAAKDALGIQSPSKEFIKVGRYADEGLAIGFERSARQPEQAARGVAQKTLSVVQSAMTAVSSIVQSGDILEINPVIRPVVDDSGIRSGAKTINASLSRTRSIAQSVSALIAQDEAEQSVENQNGDTKTTSVSFVQNNYSPKALSRIDIYRDTKNQISQMKGALT